MKFFKLIILISTAFIVIWCAGLVLFLMQLNNTASANMQKADAIVVLTGGSQRVEQGLLLLEKGSGDKLFISGAGKGVTIADLYRSVALENTSNNNVILGYKARDTKGNAKEIAQWIAEHNIKSIILVTSNYHIERAIVEIRKISPDIKIIRYPVISKNIKTDDWWKYQKSRDFIIKEYNKFFAAVVGIKRQ